MRTLSKILLCILVSLNGFFVGISYARLINAGEGQGLAAAAIFLGYGVGAGFVSLLISLFLLRISTQSRIVLLNKIMGLVLVFFLAFFSWSAYMRASEKKSAAKEKERYIQQSVSTKLIRQQGTTAPTGIGLFRPNLEDVSTLHFYGGINFQKSLDEHSPYDSIKFTKVDPGVAQIKTAPAWLAPEHLKLDYGIFYFTVISQSDDFIEIIGNKYTEQKTFVSRYSGKVILWEDFLLTVDSVEPVDPSSNPLRIKPLDHSSTVNTTAAHLRPVRINTEWIQVEMLDENLQAIGMGWVRWRKNSKIVLLYSLLS